jgi:hypothetical protein
MQILKTVGAVVACLSLALPATAPAFAAARPQAKSQGKAQNRAAPTRAGTPTAKASPNVNRPGNKPKVSNQQAYKAGQASNNRNKKDVVVVNGGGYNNGYHNNGYNNGRYYEDDDNDFLEFVGKTAAITAGASVVAAVIGSSTKEKPSDCQPVNANGQSYMFCNGRRAAAVRAP